MSLLRKNRQGVGRLLDQTYTLGLAFAVLLFAGSAVYFACPTPKIRGASPKLNLRQPLDPLGRQTPRSSLIGFLRYAAIRRLRNRRSFLAAPAGPGDTIRLNSAKELRRLYPNFQGSINLVSDDPNGYRGSRASAWPGACRCHNGVAASADVILVRVNDPVVGRFG